MAFAEELRTVSQAVPPGLLEHQGLEENSKKAAEREAEQLLRVLAEAQVPEEI